MPGVGVRSAEEGVGDEGKREEEQGTPEENKGTLQGHAAEEGGGGRKTESTRKKGREVKEGDRQDKTCLQEYTLENGRTASP